MSHSDFCHYSTRIRFSQTLSGHHVPITALDFSEPYGTLVSSSAADEEGGGARVWDLASGEELGRLVSQDGGKETVKCIQVDDATCVTGGSDACIRLWDLRKVGPDTPPNALPTVDEEGYDHVSPEPLALTSTLHGHAQAISALYFEDSTLVRTSILQFRSILLSFGQVSGASDKTIRQWDMNTGQCVLTMDILWAIAHPPATARPSHGSSSLAASMTGTFSVPAPPSSDGSWDMYEDFVGGLQFWGFALVSGSGDSAVRMWDSECFVLIEKVFHLIAPSF